MPDRAAKIQKQLGETIRVEREARGLSQEKMAEAAGLSRNFYGCIERAEKMASVETVVRLAEAMGTTAGKLLEKAGL